MTPYSYADCLKTSYRINWRIEDVLADHQFDLAKRWLPLSLSGASRVTCLSEADKLKLTQVEMASYAHLFGYVEEFIAPKMSELASAQALHERETFDALSNFVAEEVKHMTLFRIVRARVNDTLGFNTQLVGGEADTAKFVLSKHSGAVLLLTAAIEWFTQRHYQEAFRDDAELDALTLKIFKAHWLEESQCARMDHLETLRAFEAMGSQAERDQAIYDLIELVAAVAGLLEAQATMDVSNFEQHLGRSLTQAERQEVFTGVYKAKLWTFIESGTSHPNFLELFLQVSTPEQQARVMQALHGLFSQPAQGMAA